MPATDIGEKSGRKRSGRGPLSPEDDVLYEGWALSHGNYMLSMEPWAATKKSFKLVWRCHHLLYGFLAKSRLPRVSRQSRRSLMTRVILGTVHISPGICLIAEENPGKPQLQDRLMKGLCDQSSPQMRSLSSK